MKNIVLTTIAAVVLVGCGDPPKDIWEAARNGSIEAVEQFLATGVDVNAKDEDGVPPLLVATANGRKEIVELLIREGADVNAKVNGVTPLHQAAIQGHKEIAKLLIAKGAHF